MGSDHHGGGGGGGGGGVGGGGGGATHSYSSSIDSSNSNHPPFLSSSVASSSASAASASAASVSNDARRDLSTDLKLGLSISPTSNNINNVDVSSSTSTQREQRLDWPPMKPLLRSTLADQKADHDRHGHASLFVKVYMEGIPIGRKLDLLAHDGYNSLMTSLRHMFRTTILRPGDIDGGVHNSGKRYHVLTYEDKEGDWMMVGDVPWEMFLSSVKRLKITRADKC